MVFYRFLVFDRSPFLLEAIGTYNSRLLPFQAHLKIAQEGLASSPFQQFSNK